MARGTQHRKRRPPANAGVAHAAVAPKRHKRPAYEEQLFFGRLRTHAKVLFVLMAVVFVLTFVFLGVGSGSTGISQIVQNFFSGTSASGSSLSSLQKKTVEHPKDAAAWLAYANKLQADKKLDNAATALKTYTTLKPKDADALSQLAGIYTQRATDWETLYTASQQRTQALSPSPLLTPKSTSKLGKALATITNPLASAVASESSVGDEQRVQPGRELPERAARRLQAARQAQPGGCLVAVESRRQRPRTQSTRRPRSRPTRPS